MQLTLLWEVPWNISVLSNTYDTRLFNLLFPFAWKVNMYIVLCCFRASKRSQIVFIDITAISRKVSLPSPLVELKSCYCKPAYNSNIALIIAVIKSGLNGIRNHDLCDTGAVL